jgi:hypothetical protein
MTTGLNPIPALRRAARATPAGIGRVWRWFWQDRRSLLGYLMGGCVFINFAVGFRILGMTEPAFIQIPTILSALALFDGAVFALGAAHSIVQGHVDDKAAAAVAVAAAK